MTTPALYRTRVTHLRRAPVHHYFEHKSYIWYVDIGDACVWWGLWLISITSWPARLTEKNMEGRPGFDDYRSRTSFFIPRPARAPTDAD